MEDVTSMGSPVLIFDQINAERNERKGKNLKLWYMLTSIEVWMSTSKMERRTTGKNHWTKNSNSTKIFSYSKDIIHHPRNHLL